MKVIKTGLFFVVSFFILPGHVSAASLAEGVAAYDAGDLQTARSVFEAAYEADKDDAEATYHLARVELTTGNYKKAESLFGDAIDIDDEQSRYHQGLAETYGAEINDAGMFKQMRLARKIRKSFQRAVDLDADNIDARFGLIQFYVSAPGIAGGDTDKALVHANEIAQRDSIAGYRAHIQIYQAEEQYDKALEIAESWLSEDTDGLDPTLSLGIRYTAMERYGDAFKTYDNWLDTHESGAADAPSVYYQFGRTASISGEKLDKGEDAFRRYFVYKPKPDEPSHAWAHYRLGLIYKHGGHMQAARGEFEIALELEPNHKQAKDALDDL